MKTSVEDMTMTGLVKSAFTGDTDPLYYIAIMGVVIVVAALVIIIGAKRRK